jgi:hypothetical protein
VTGRATPVGAALLTALVVAVSVGIASASAQESERPPSELWSEYPLDPQKSETPPPVVGDEGAGRPPADVDTVPRREPRPAAPATSQAEGEEFIASPLIWILLVVLLLAVALAVAAMGALPQAVEALAGVAARLRARDRAAALRTAVATPVRIGRRAAADVPRALSRLTGPGAARVRRARRARRPVVAMPRRAKAAGPDVRVRETTGIAETLVERTRDYTMPEPAPKAEERVIARGIEHCEIRWWRGYLKSQFYAQAVTKEGIEVVVARSPMFRWRHAEPPAPTKAAVAARMALVETLVAQGWRVEPTPRDSVTRAPWFAGRFRYRVRATSRAPL